MSEFISEKQTADYLNLSQRTLQRMRAENTGPKFYRIGKRITYRKLDIESWLANQNTISFTGEK